MGSRLWRVHAIVPEPKPTTRWAGPAHLGERASALAELDRLRSGNSLSHRAHRQWGVLRAMSAETEPSTACGALGAFVAKPFAKPHDTLSE